MRRAIMARWMALAMLVVAVVAPQWSRAASSVSPIVDGDSGYLLGGVQNGRWLNATATARLLRGGEGYRLYGATASLGATVGGRPATRGAPCDTTQFVKLSPAPRRANTLAVGGSWNALPRVPAQLSTASVVYRSAVRDLLRAHGISQPDVRLTKVLRVDLEGDGVDEVLISATRLVGGSASPNVAAGDYSLVMLRKVVNGKAQTLVVDAEYHPKAREFVAPNVFTIRSVLDLNGDRRMEVVVDSQYYEGNAVIAYAINGATARAVVGAGCGA